MIDSKEMFMRNLVLIGIGCLAVVTVVAAQNRAVPALGGLPAGTPATVFL